MDDRNTAVRVVGLAELVRTESGSRLGLALFFSFFPGYAGYVTNFFSLFLSFLTFWRLRHAVHASFDMLSSSLSSLDG